MNDGSSLPFERMVFVCNLGEGAFGTVEKRELKYADGTAAAFAVKRLKKQDIPKEELAVLDTAGQQVQLPALLKRMNSRATEQYDREGSVRGGNIQDAPPPVDTELESLIQGLSEDDQLFLQEVNIMRRLSHPHIIRFLGCGILEDHDAARIAIAQELCEGGDLQKMIQRAAAGGGTGKRLYSYGDALRWSIQVARALAYLHGANPQVLHRDLKQENLLLSDVGRAGDIRVMDFGLTKLRRIVEVGYDKASKSTEPYVMTGQTGSCCYMAPEVTRGEKYNEKVDIFSFAIIMYELFSMNLVSIINHKSGLPEEFQAYAKRVAGGYREKVKPTWPQELQDIITESWAADPEQRPSAQTICQRLSAMQSAIDEWDTKNSRGVVKANAASQIAKQGVQEQGSCCTIC